ncbi:Crp/Fnr family transcriptional regulator [Flavihumibacter profundi]|uniref:Crp/Fnr family transcriptional regulator n=1 Tax=Flavihumibacter profundi TaxID=2716883 RepID=UPI001CC79346|nr:Crp/Fnr family transcriptional regulator [Flavihumibacter profundi]MBZ5856984.1 Crp/Fnr family transcriptional regulator [Flavihumibacter profundi]
MKDEKCNLSSCFLCKHCIPEWKEVVAAKKKTIQFKKGELLFKEGQKVNGIFFLYSGAAKVHKQWVGEKELIIRFTREGDILGHRGLAAGELYPVSATALVESKACFITNSFLETTLKADHGFTYRLLQFYTTELQKAEMRMRNLALMEVNARIAETILEIQEVFGRNSDGYITVPVTRQDIASYSGSTYETVFKFFKTLTASKTISVLGKSIRINNEKKLQMIIANAK